MKQKERAAMQAAWVWMDWYSSNNGTLEPVDFNETITALREALKQPDEIDWIETNKSLAKEIIELKKQAEQEPVAAYRDAPRTIYLQTGCEDPEFCECSFNEWGDTTWCTDKIHDTDIPYIREDYTRPVRTKDLTDSEIEIIMYDFDKADDLGFARAVIAADREKNHG